MFVSVDIGGTQIRVALVDDQFQILGKKSSGTGFDSDPKIVCDNMTHMIQCLSSESGFIEILGAGVSARTVSNETGILVNPPNLPNWNGFSVTDFITNKFDIPVIAANDASLAALGLSLIHI